MSSSEEEIEYIGDVRPPTRQEIITKMNYRLESTDDYSHGFHDGLRETLSEALTIPSADYGTHFNEERLYKMRWFLRCDRRALAYTYPPETRDSVLASCTAIEERFPEVLTYLDQDPPRRWGKLGGEHAAVRWLQEPDRNFAEDTFPCLDT